MAFGILPELQIKVLLYYREVVCLICVQGCRRNDNHTTHSIIWYIIKPNDIRFVHFCVVLISEITYKVCKLGLWARCYRKSWHGGSISKCKQTRVACVQLIFSHFKNQNCIRYVTHFPEKWGQIDLQVNPAREVQLTLEQQFAFLFQIYAASLGILSSSTGCCWWCLMFSSSCCGGLSDRYYSGRRNAQIHQLYSCSGNVTWI
jgi:hypothetical protein